MALAAHGVSPLHWSTYPQRVFGPQTQAQLGRSFSAARLTRLGTLAHCVVTSGGLRRVAQTVPRFSVSTGVFAEAGLARRAQGWHRDAAKMSPPTPDRQAADSLGPKYSAVKHGRGGRGPQPRPRSVDKLLNSQLLINPITGNWIN